MGFVGTFIKVLSMEYIDYKTFKLTDSSQAMTMIEDFIKNFL